MSRAAPLAMARSLLGKSVLLPFARGGRQGLSTLIYHRVLPQRDELFPGEIEQAEFDHQIALLKACFNVLPLVEAMRRLRAGTLPPRAACITFDDGYLDNLEVALPVLLKHQVSATFFVATGFLDGGSMWNDSIIELVRNARGGALDARPLGLDCHPLGTLAQRRQAITLLINQLKYLPPAARQAQVARLAEIADCAPRGDLMMRPVHLRQLRAAGMQIGAHTVNHAILATLPAAQARAEIAEGRAMLEHMTGAPVPLFAYPNGKPGKDYLAEHVAMVRELGFEGAASTAWGASRGEPDLFQLPRFTPWDRGSASFLLRLARNLTRPAGRVESAAPAPGRA